MRLLREAVREGEAEEALEHVLAQRPHGPCAPLRRMLALLRDNPRAFATVRAVSQGLAHDRSHSSAEEALSSCREGFDMAAKASPEASVALYSLGSPALLREATAEVAGWLRGNGLVGTGMVVLDIGCGIGRFEEALAPDVNHIIGVDLAGTMLSRAMHRCRGLTNVSFVQGDGRNLSFIASAVFDVVLSVDAFPYLVHAETAIARAHVEDASRALRPGGSLVVLNYSYRGDVETDRADVAQAAARAGLEVLVNGASPFNVWDARAFVLRKPVHSRGLDMAMRQGFT